MCDYCGEWFHMDCVGISDEQVMNYKHYKCNTCLSTGKMSRLYDPGVPLCESEFVITTQCLYIPNFSILESWS